MKFHSNFGGLWIDNIDQREVRDKLETISNKETKQKVQDFIRDGYIIIPGAVSVQDIDNYLFEYDNYIKISGGFEIEIPTQGGRQEFSREKSNIPGSKVLDTAMLLSSGENICFSPPIANFINTIFEDFILAFQTLHFDVGSTQAIHQDTAYVVVKNEPMKLCASWIALEDVNPGSGELVYYAGGHRIDEYTYADGSSKHFDIIRDGNDSHDRHLSYIHEEASRLGLNQKSFLPRKGDALIWHADLPHGGGKITSPGASRRSIVTHYCPISHIPNYADFIPESWREKSPTPSGNAFMSSYYDPNRIAVRRSY